MYIYVMVWNMYKKHVFVMAKREYGFDTPFNTAISMYCTAYTCIAVHLLG